MHYTKWIILCPWYESQEQYTHQFVVFYWFLRLLFLCWRILILWPMLFTWRVMNWNLKLEFDQFFSINESSIQCVTSSCVIELICICFETNVNLFFLIKYTNNTWASDIFSSRYNYVDNLLPPKSSTILCYAERWPFSNIIPALYSDINSVFNISRFCKQLE